MITLRGNAASFLPGYLGLAMRRNRRSRSLSKWYSFATSIRLARKLQARTARSIPASGPIQ